MAVTPFDTKQLWDIFNENALAEETSPARVLAKAQLINALLPAISYNPAQMRMVLEMAVFPAVRNQYPEIPDSRSAAEAMRRLGNTVVFRSNDSVTGSAWYIDRLSI